MNEIKRVGFIVHYMIYGGSVKVSYSTSLQLKQRGVSSTFFSLGYHNPEKWILPNDRMIGMKILPNKNNFVATENVQFIIDTIIEEDIQLLFITAPVDRIPTEIREKTGCKLAYWLHSMPFWEIPDRFEREKVRGQFSLKWWFKYNLLTKPFIETPKIFNNKIRNKYIRQIESVDFYIVLCKNYKEQLKEKLDLPHYNEEKIVPIINTIEINPSPTLLKKKEIVFIGRISHAEKRVDRLLKIWKNIGHKLPEWKLKIFGSGPDEWILEDFIEKNSLQNVEICGYKEDVQKTYDDASILCLTSNFEGWGLVLTEAQNNGVVPMTFDNFEAARFIIGDNNYAGRLIPSFDLDTYSEQLYELCVDQNLLTQLQKNCLLKRWDYTPEVNAESWDTILNSKTTKHE